MIQQFHFEVSVQRKCKLTQKDICIPRFIAALFTLAKIQNNLCPLMDEWIKIYMYIGIYIDR